MKNKYQWLDEIQEPFDILDHVEKFKDNMEALYYAQKRFDDLAPEWYETAYKFWDGNHQNILDNHWTPMKTAGENLIDYAIKHNLKPSEVTQELYNYTKQGNELPPGMDIDEFKDNKLQNELSSKQEQPKTKLKI